MKHRIGIPKSGANWDDLDQTIADDVSGYFATGRVRDVIGHGRAWRRLETDEDMIATQMKMAFGRMHGVAPGE